MNNPKEIILDLDGEVKIWIEQEGSICIKAVSSYGDPVELTVEQAKLLYTGLENALKRLHDLDGKAE